jgi:uncharacterized protein (DUF2147 family)
VRARQLLQQAGRRRRFQGVLSMLNQSSHNRDTRVLALLLGCAVCSATALVIPADIAAADRLGEQNIVGEWWTEDRSGRVTFFLAKTGTYTARLSYSKNPRKDVENDDPKMRSRDVVGIVLIWKLKYEEDQYVDGYVYNPEDGNIYRIEVTSIDKDSIKVRGFMGISLFGQSQIWKRYR